jgi:Flp pilus assembly protein TadD
MMENKNHKHSASSQIEDLLKHYSNKNYLKAIDKAHEILNLIPANHSIEKILASSLKNIGKASQAISIFKNILDSNADDGEAMFGLANAYLELKHYDDAITYYKKLIRLSSDNVEAYNNLGIALLAIQDFKEAEYFLKKSLELKFNNASTHNNLGIVLCAKGKFKAAEESFLTAIRINHNYLQGYKNLADLYFLVGKKRKLVKTLQKVIELSPRNVSALNQLGAAYNSLELYDQAEDSFRKAILINPSDSGAQYNLGLVYYKNKDFLNALKHFKLSELKSAKNHVLKCLYALDQKAAFYEHLDSMISSNENNAVIGSIISASNLQYNFKKENIFCQNPFNFIYTNDLNSDNSFDKKIASKIRNIFDMPKLPLRPQGLLMNGVQTYGNIFNLNLPGISFIENILRDELDKFLVLFKDSNEGFIKKWPKKFKLYGWLIKMSSGGELLPHMHETGWITGSLYINIPKKLRSDEGNLMLTIDNRDRPLSRDMSIKKNIIVQSGTICLFPASLLHYTTPFESKEDRIVLAFDMIPNE